MTEDNLQSIHENMRQELEKNGVTLTAIYCCQHKPEDQCACRKPKPGMLHDAAKDLNLDLTQVLFIGDTEQDMQAGAAAGCKTLLVTPQQNLLTIVKTVLSSGPSDAHVFKEKNPNEAD